MTAIQANGSLVAANNDLYGSFLAGGAGLVIARSNRMAFSDERAFSYMGSGRALLDKNEIDARVLNTKPRTANTPELVFLRNASGEFVVRSNEVRVSPAFRETDWFRCIDSPGCDVQLIANRLVTGASSPPERPSKP